MTNPSIFDRAVSLVSDCTVPQHLIGFSLLAEAAVIKSNNYSIKVTRIYNYLAQRHSTYQRAVARNINYAISQAPGICEALSLRPQDIFNSRVISTIAFKLRSLVNSVDDD